MDPDQKNIIRKNLVFLADNTTNLPYLLIQLIAEGVLSEYAQQLIESKPTSIEKNNLLYSEVQKTGKFAELIAALDASHNSEVADKLRVLPSYKLQRSTSSTSDRPSTSTSTTEKDDDFSISELGVLEMVTILENYPKIKVEWKKVVIKLELSGKSQGKLPVDGDFGNLVLETINLWRNEKGGQATFNTFVEAIKTTINQNVVVEKLQDAKNRIRTAK